MPTRDTITADEAFDGLPPEIRKAIESSGWQEKLRRVAGAKRLRIDQGAALEDETLRFMAGLQSIEEYAVHLAQEIPMPQNEFQAFVAELEREIFVPIQAKLKEIMPSVEEGSAPAAASVGANEEDDLEALLNTGEEALARVAASAPRAAVVATPGAGLAKPTAPSPFGGVVSAPASSTPNAAAGASAPRPSNAGGAIGAAVPKFPAVPTNGLAAATPMTPSVAQPPALAAAAAKLSAPVVKPAETVLGNLQRPSGAPSAPSASSPLSSAPTSPASSSDPYREPLR